MPFKILTDWNFLLSIITAGTAIIALCLTRKQIKLSNKQHLFDKRIENYLIVMGLIELYKNNREFFDEAKYNDYPEPPLTFVNMFYWMTNNTYLEQIAIVIEYPLKNPKHKEFLIKLEDMKNVATKIRFIFSGKEADLLSNFVLQYQECLSKMVQYAICCDSIKKEANELGDPLNDGRQNELVINKWGELISAYENLKHSYNTLDNANYENNLEKQIQIK